MMRVFCCFAAVLLSCQKTNATQELKIFAASSLQQVFTSAGKEFSKSHATLQITFNFAGTQELRTQIEHGATPDVFASADLRHMEELFRGGWVEQPIVFARNELVLVVSKEASARIKTFQDLPLAKKIVLGAPHVPVGRYAQTVLSNAGLWASVVPRVVSYEFNVKQVLMKVRSGDAEAGLVYHSDVVGLQDVVSHRIPQEWRVVADYSIAETTASPNKPGAKVWIEFLRSQPSQHLFFSAGFLPFSSDTDT